LKKVSENCLYDGIKLWIWSVIDQYVISAWCSISSVFTRNSSYCGECSEHWRRL